MKATYTIKETTHEYNGKEHVDLVACFGKDKTFTLVPLSKSKKARALFYALLKGEARM